MKIEKEGIIRTIARRSIPIEEKVETKKELVSKEKDKYNSGRGRIL